MKKTFYAIILILSLVFTASCRYTVIKSDETVSSPTENESDEQAVAVTAGQTDTSSGDIAVPDETTAVSPARTGKISYGAHTGTEATITGLEPLPVYAFVLPEGHDYSALSHETIDFSFGAASDGQPSARTVENQKFMREHGFAALCCDVDSTEKNVYLTFDVGYENGYTEKILDILKEKNVTAAFFCTKDEAQTNPVAVARMVNEGHIVGNHSVTHPDFSGLTEEEIIAELQGFDDYARGTFGYSSLYFRYPQGKYSEFTERILTDLGFTSVFWSIAYADWDLKAQPAEDEAMDTLLGRLHPGAVILLHAVSPTNCAILPDFIDEIRAQGYEFVSLENYDG